MQDGCHSAVGEAAGAIGGWLKGADGKWRTFDDHQSFLVQTRAKSKSRQTYASRKSQKEIQVDEEPAKQKPPMHIIVECLRGTDKPLPALEGGQDSPAAMPAPILQNSMQQLESAVTGDLSSMEMLPGPAAGMRAATVKEIKDRANDILESLRKQLLLMERRIVDVSISGRCLGAVTSRLQVDRTIAFVIDPSSRRRCWP